MNETHSPDIDPTSLSLADLGARCHPPITKAAAHSRMAALLTRAGE